MGRKNKPKTYAEQIVMAWAYSRHAYRENRSGFMKLEYGENALDSFRRAHEMQMQESPSCTALVEAMSICDLLFTQYSKSGLDEFAKETYELALDTHERINNISMSAKDLVPANFLYIKMNLYWPNANLDHLMELLEYTATLIDELPENIWKIHLLEAGKYDELIQFRKQRQERDNYVRERVGSEL